MPENPEQTYPDIARVNKWLSDFPEDDFPAVLAMAAMYGRDCTKGSGNVISDEEMTRLMAWASMSFGLNVALVKCVCDAELEIHFDGDEPTFKATEKGLKEAEALVATTS